MYNLTQSRAKSFCRLLLYNNNNYYFYFFHLWYIAVLDKKNLLDNGGSETQTSFYIPDFVLRSVYHLKIKKGITTRNLTTLTLFYAQ